MSRAYKDAGVDIQAGYESVERIKKHVQRTMRPEVLTGIGGFGAMFELPVDRYKHPVLISGTDGVGTKLKIAFSMDQHQTIGQDVVAMCVNDIVVHGAEPLYFLDYFACGHLLPAQVEDVVQGIADGCQQAGCALIGGETAEMPGFYPQGEYDLAGFCVGVVEKERIIDGSKIQEGDVLIGLPSSGVHSNGFSLVRKILTDNDVDLKTPLTKTESLGERLLAPTRIYVKTVLALLERFDVHGMAHITGGGLEENIPRMLPQTCDAYVDQDKWPVPDIFHWLQEKGNIHTKDMFRTFNMGIGFVLAVTKDDARHVLQYLHSSGEQAYAIGWIERGKGKLRFGGVSG